MALHFSSDDSSVIKKQMMIHKPDPVTDEKILEALYEIPRCIEWINENNYSHVALQFPDHMLVDAAAVVSAIAKHCQNSHLYILADTSYGSCCVDEVAAEHILANALIHFGHSCLSPTNHLPSLFVFGTRPVDSTDAVERFRELFPEKKERIFIVYDVMYKNAADSLYEELKSEYRHLKLSTLVVNSTLPSKTPQLCSSCTSCKNFQNETVAVNDENSLHSQNITKIGRIFKLCENHCINDYTMFYIGQEGPCLVNLMMTFNGCSFCSYDPESKISRKETISVNKALMKRYYLIEKAKDANIVGILIGTLGVSNYLSIVKQLKQLIVNSGKKCYTIVVGKINVAKLANFPEIDVYVLVACPENTLIDSKEFFQPIVTPYEMEIACNSARSWTGDYITDFRQLLPGAESHVPFVGQTIDNIGMSLTTGQMRSLCVGQDDNSCDSTTIAKRNDMMVALHEHGAGEFLHNRSWKGLDPSAIEAKVEKAAEGRHGIAAIYENEQEHFVKDQLNSET